MIGRSSMYLYQSGWAVCCCITSSLPDEFSSLSSHAKPEVIVIKLRTVILDFRESGLPKSLYSGNCAYTGVLVSILAHLSRAIPTINGANVLLAERILCGRSL